MPLKITMKAVLVEVSEEHKKEIDKLMTVFSSAIRFDFNRIIEGMKIGDIEKSIASRYKLNIRQAKDAVENARQTLVSQKQLIKQNYEAYTSKAAAIEKILNDTSKELSDKRRKALVSKLEKRKRRQKYLKSYIDNNTIPPVIFGTKSMFLKRCKGLITHDEWVECRTNRVYSRGDKTKCGNPNLRVIIKNGMSFLEISTLEKTVTNRAIKISVPVYLPQKHSKKTGKINGNNYRELFLKHLASGEAYQVEMKRSKGKYYCHITFELPKPETIYTGHANIIGIDTNPDGLALTMIDNKGNYKSHTYLKQHELLYARSNRRSNLCGELVKEAINTAKEMNVV